METRGRVVPVSQFRDRPAKISMYFMLYRIVCASINSCKERLRNAKNFEGIVLRSKILRNYSTFLLYNYNENHAQWNEIRSQAVDDSCEGFSLYCEQFSLIGTQKCSATAKEAFSHKASIFFVACEVFLRSHCTVRALLQLTVP